MLQDNVKFLTTLERHFKSLSVGSMQTIVETLPSLMNAIRMVWIISRCRSIAICATYPDVYIYYTSICYISRCICHICTYLEVYIHVYMRVVVYICTRIYIMLQIYI